MESAGDQNLSFLDDILEEFTDIPDELRAMLNKYRELYSQVKSERDDQNNKSEFFQRVKIMSAEERKNLFKRVMKALKPILEDTDEKIELISALQMGLEAHIKQLDKSIAEKKEVLDRADPGISAAIEKKFDEETSTLQNDVSPPQRRNE